MIPKQMKRAFGAYASALKHAEDARAEATRQLGEWAKAEPQKRIAAVLGWSPSYINDVIHGNRKLSKVRVTRIIETISGGR